MENKDSFSNIHKKYSTDLKNIFRKYDIPERPKPIEEQVIITQPITEDIITQVTLERWTVYSFTLPIKITKRIAFGFASQEEAREYINKKLVKRDSDGIVIPKTMTVDDVEYIVNYDTIRESLEKVDVYYNDPEITTVGNNKEAVLKEYLS